jgi:hypothetical protein
MQINHVNMPAVESILTKTGLHCCDRQYQTTMHLGCPQLTQNSTAAPYRRLQFWNPNTQILFYLNPVVTHMLVASSHTCCMDVCNAHLSHPHLLDRHHGNNSCSFAIHTLNTDSKIQVTTNSDKNFPLY